MINWHQVNKWLSLELHLINKFYECESSARQYMIKVALYLNDTISEI